MAGNIWITQTDGISVAASTTKTLLQVCAAGSNLREKVTKTRVSIIGGDRSDPPVLVELLYQSTAGSGSSSATPVKRNPSYSESLTVTGIQGPTSEPTAGTILDYKFISPVQGEAEFSVPREIPGSGRLGIRATVASGAATITAKALMEGEE